jgi:hypothetical protein
VPLDAAQEFQVLTGQFDAEFGRTSGAIVNAVIKSGTNAYHGSAFEFFYNPSTRAKDFFQAQNNLDKADTRKNEFGGSVGGPIVLDKVHFFVDVERVMLNEGRRFRFPRGRISITRPSPRRASGTRCIASTTRSTRTTAGAHAGSPSGRRRRIRRTTPP